MAALRALVSVVLFATPVVPVERTAPAIEYVDLSLRWTRTGMTVLAARRGRFARPVELVRYRGRFEAMVKRAGRVVERIRFDFPLLAPAEAEDVSDEARASGARIRAGVTSTRTTVRVPLYEGVDAIEVRDAASGRAVTVELAKPPPRLDAEAGAPPAR